MRETASWILNNCEFGFSSGVFGGILVKSDLVQRQAKPLQADSDDSGGVG